MMDLYCQHVVTAQVLDDEIKAFDREWLRDDDGLKRYDRLLAMRGVKSALHRPWRPDCVSRARRQLTPRQ